MTTSTLSEVARRKASRAQIHRTTFAEDLRLALEEQARAAHEIRWPSTHYQQDPVGFFREILGIEPWSRQIELLEAVRDHDRVACKSGRRVSKSNSVAGLALWYYCSYPDARVIMTSTTARQVDQILWREVQMMRARSGRCVDCKAEDPDARRIPTPCPHSARIGGDIGQLARTGLRPGVEGDHREIVGFTARESEAFQGIAGSNLFFIADEASGIPQAIYDAIEGNRAGGGKVVLTGNPTQNAGEFFDAFGTKRATTERTTGYHTLTISSEESPNIEADEVIIPGLATREYLEERALEWGRESAMYSIHVLGEFALNEEGRVFSIEAIAQAEERWHEMPEPTDRLFVGLDPAGASGTGDETCFALRRGPKVLEIQTAIGLTEEAHLIRLLGLLTRYRRKRETPVVVLDREGAVGARVYGYFRDFAERNPESFLLVAVRASDRAHRQPKIYDRMRDELAGNLELWFREGGAVPEDIKLAAELHALEWRQQISGRMKITPKNEIRKAIARSPDRYDALALATWEPLHLHDNAAPPPPDPALEAAHPEVTFDPYDAMDVWKVPR